MERGEIVKMTTPKIYQLYDTMADIALDRMKTIKVMNDCFTEKDLQMVTAVFNLYMALPGHSGSKLYPSDETIASLERKIDIIKDSVNAGTKIRF